jgi:hypothetical protein
MRRRRIRRREALLELALARATSATNLRELLPEPLARRCAVRSAKARVTTGCGD